MYRRLLKSRYCWLAVIGLVYYFVTFFNGFVDDDLAQVVYNGYVHQLSGIAWSFNVGENLFRPLMFIYFTLCYSVFHLHAVGYHMTEVAFATANAMLIYWLFKQFVSKNIAFVAAFIYLIHPLNVDAVSYVSHIQDVLFMFFGLLGLRFVKVRTDALWKTAAIGLCVFLGLLSKETELVFIPMILLFAYLYQRSQFKKIALSIAFFFVAYLVLRFSVRVGEPQIIQAPVASLDLVHRLIQGPSIVWFYIFNFFAPHNLSISRLQVVKGVSIEHFWLPLLAILLVVWVLWLGGARTAKKNPKLIPAYCFFGLWFALGLIAHIQIIPLFDATVSDWWFYFPMVGLLGMLAVLFNTINWSSINYRLLLVPLTLWLLFLGLQGISRQKDYKNETTLISHDISVNPDSYLLEDEYGTVLLAQGKYADAENYFFHSASLSLHNNFAWYYLGNTYQAEGSSSLANYYFHKEINDFPSDWHGYYGLSVNLINAGEYNKAIDVLKTGVVKSPNDPRLWSIYGLAEIELGNKQSAEKAAKKAEFYAQKLNIPFTTKQFNGATAVSISP